MERRGMMVIYATLRDCSRDEIGAGSKLKSVYDIRITVAGTNLQFRQISPAQVGDYEIKNIVAQLGRLNWLCTPEPCARPSYFCYRQVAHEEEYQAALEEIRNMIIVDDIGIAQEE